MRVIAGKYRSRQLKSVNSKLTRPTTDKNKENLFNMIGPYFDGGICLDLFAGSGGLGIEAISRGMNELYSVDHQFKAYSTIKDNVTMLNIQNQCHVHKMDYKKALMRFNEENLKFDLVLLDPPYGLKISKSILSYLKDNCMLNDGCIIVIEDLKDESINMDAPFYLKKEHHYGITILQIFIYKE